MTVNTNETSTFIKKMASPDEKVRGRAIHAVKTLFAKRGGDMSYDEFLKLWKGFFYCFWLSDKPDLQNSLSSVIAQFAHILPGDKDGNFMESGASLYIRSFWETMGREWPLLDRLRLNKYYHFMKTMLFESFKLIETNSWSSDLLNGHESILNGTVFDFSNRAYPDSLRIFVIESYFEVLLKVHGDEHSFSSEQTVLITRPVIQAVSLFESKAFFKQATEALIQGLIPQVEEGEEDMDEEIGGDEFDNEDEEVEVEEEEEAEFESAEQQSELEFSEEDSDGFKSEEFDNFDDQEIENEQSEDESISDAKADCCGAEHDCCGSEVDCCDDNSNCCDDEAEGVHSIFDFESLKKLSFEIGGQEKTLTRNRRFLFDLSKIFGDIIAGSDDCGECCEH